MLRRLLSLAPLPLTQAIGLILTGTSGLVLAFVTLPSAGAPPPASTIIAALALALVARGALGLSGLRNTFRGLLGAGEWSGRAAPRTQAEIDDLLKRRPDGWEFFLMAGYLLNGRAEVEPRYLDHELGFLPPLAESVNNDGALNFLHEATTAALRIIENFSTLFDRSAMERAVGQPGEPGDPERIHHLAQRWTDNYAALLGWAARLRAVGTSERYQPIFRAQASLLDRTVRNYRELVDLFAAEVEKMATALKAGREYQVNLDLALDLDPADVARLQKEIERIGNST